MTQASPALLPCAPAVVPNVFVATDRPGPTTGTKLTNPETMNWALLSSVRRLPQPDPGELAPSVAGSEKAAFTVASVAPIRPGATIWPGHSMKGSILVAPTPAKRQPPARAPRPPAPRQAASGSLTSLVAWVTTVPSPKRVTSATERGSVLSRSSSRPRLECPIGIRTWTVRGRGDTRPPVPPLPPLHAVSAHLAAPSSKVPEALRAGLPAPEVASAKPSY